MGELQNQIKRLYGPTVSVKDSRSVSGGCINDTAVITLSNNEKLFLKKNTLSPKDMFQAELIGLQRLHSAGGPKVPTPICAFEDQTHQYLLIEYISSGTRLPDYWERFGAQLAHLHRTVRHDRFGFEIDNYIGATPQINALQNNWVTFFAEMRLAPQMRWAQQLLPMGIQNKLMYLMEHLSLFIAEPEGGPSIIHGDLWTGNAMVGPNGEPVIIDPATYFGHREAEIAMTMLFGRFGERFYSAYNETWPLEKDWAERMDLYNLYHMLNHVNLFGTGYLSSVSSIVNRYV
ncbi:MAG: fructosamine kinase family protein [Deltaproteobacteria bacterium]|nr:fructosamine kinase family protein [Deltaproteobacteria bacterium]MBN2673127.1 fructosamine kinase family protein [Deltaproteobacteria bacterium]